MAQLERPPGRLRARQLRLRRLFGRTGPGRALKRLLGREPRIPGLREPEPSRLLAFADDLGLPAVERDRAVLELALRHWKPVRPTLARRPELAFDAAALPITNVVLVSHCNFRGNSAFHVLAVASQLHERGISPVIAVPDEPQTVREVGRPPFPVVTYDEALATLSFPDGRGPDLVHAWTPRELVRRTTVELVRQHAVRYVVHLEDNEETVLSAEHHGADIEVLRALPPRILDGIVRPRQAHPARARRFLRQSSGMTVIVERLLEFAPPDIPSAVVWAGFDETALAQRRSRAELRAELGLSDDDIVIVYPGNVHMVNLADMHGLYEAVALLRSRGRPVVLVKTGWGSTQTVCFPAPAGAVRDLGWVPRERVAELLTAADVLVQPGGPDSFNDFRFPSKLPEFLASGRPVVLPRTNLGLLLRDGVEGILLERGDAREIAAAVARLADDPGLRERIGAAGREFARRELTWQQSAARIHRLYQAATRPAPPAWALDGADPLVQLVAEVPRPPTAAEASAARSAGVFAFSLETMAPAETICEFRFAARSPEDVAANPLALEHVASTTALDSQDPRYVSQLRKRVLAALACAGPYAARVTVDATQVWEDADARARWLTSTRAGLEDGARQYYASRGLALTDPDAI